MAAYVPYTWSTGDTITAARLNNLETQYACAMSMVGTTLHQVGALRMTTVNVNPQSYLGGIWSAWGTGRVLVGVDTGQTEFDVAEETGGAKTHTLTATEMPIHTHVQNSHGHTQDPHDHPAGFNPSGVGSGGDGIGAAFDNTRANTSSAPIDNTTATNQATTATNQNAGSGGAHNNLQPYITGYMWKRTS